ncbi:MAG: type II secretion system protein [Gammaproteobacteria bacterium]|nr:type II secretion system protein [Gammaproteobacteria bacterium]
MKETQANFSETFQALSKLFQLSDLTVSDQGCNTMKSMTAMNAKRKQSGFTIIELVVVILLLGILTATALPRFMDVTNEAHEAVVDAVTGGFSTGVALFRAQWVGEGQPLTAVTDAEGFNLYASSTGYPRGSITPVTVGASMTTAATCGAVYASILQAGGRPILDDLETTGVTPVVVTARETIVETRAAADTTADFIAVLNRDNATPTASTVSCTYYYVGQFRSGAASPANVTIPSITYDFSTGAVSTGTLVMNQP